ncbi:hypothetical protein ACJIZ3_019576 [Penstemon smallii]|uniref:Chlororespiratory reduction 3 n=1 Tax=Penstemon smallii TaxID=265156 RepID=A0ABD3T1J9_9LAMI
MAIILNCHSITKPKILISSALPNNDNSSPSNFKSNNKLPKIKINEKELQLQQKNLKRKKLRQPSVSEIERAIGAGIYRDTNSEEEEKNSLFDNVLKYTIGKSEGDLEKNLRETGEWLVYQSEKTSNSVGKQIIVAMFVWIMPAWLFAFVLASGIVKIPFLEEIFL